MRNLVATASMVLVSLGLTLVLQPPPAAGQPAPKAKGKGEPKKKGGPLDDLRKAYDLLTRLRAADSSAGRPEERIRDWTERATSYYRDGVKSYSAGDEFLAHEYGAIAHDLARAVDHARNAALFDHRDSDLAPPPDGFGANDSGELGRRDLSRAYDRISELGDRDPAPAAGFYLKAARDLYRAARRDLEAGREERGGELARAAEAMTHVAEHLGHASDGPPPGRGRLGLRTGPEPTRKRIDRSESDLPPPLPPG
jgi:hypothetical protein